MSQNNSFMNELTKILTSIESLKNSLPLLLVTIEEEINKTQNEQINYIVQNGIESINEGELEKTYHLSIEHYYEIKKYDNQLFNLNKAKILLPNSFLVSLICQYDAFIGGLIRVIYTTIPEKLNSSEKKILFSQLMDFNDLQEARNFILEKEIETVLRNSHVEQIKWLESKVDMVLTKDLDIWTTFVEITERRNLFVHTDGVVSDQYISNCSEHKVPFEKKPKLGDCLKIDVDYFSNAANCLFELCVKLVTVIWRKIIPDEIEKSDFSLNHICFDLIKDEEYQLALKLLEFGTNILKKHPNEQYYLFMVINKAQAYKWIGENEKCISIVESIDWTAKNDQFLLAKSVLLDDFSSAGKLMLSIGNNGNGNQADYKSWPLYKEFRKTEIFKTAFEKIFKEKLQITQSDIVSTNSITTNCNE